MQFSMIFEAQLADPTPAEEQRVYADLVEQAILGEEMGFDRIWIVEHHGLRWYSHSTAPEVFLGYLAAATKRMRLGHGVMMLPKGFNHPIRAAERVATLDILSNGRADFGTGVSSSEQEMGAFGVDPDTRYDEWREALQMIPRMWRDEDFEHHGTWFDVPSRPVLPKPVQQPHPPMFMACSRIDSIERAGRMGLGALSLGFGGPDDVARKRKAYDDAISTRDPGDVVGAFPTEHLSALCPAIVLADRERAVRLGVRGQRFFADSIAHWYQGEAEPDPSVDLSDQIERYLADAPIGPMPQHLVDLATSTPDGWELARSLDTFQRPQIVDGCRAYGDVGDAMRYVSALIEAGADEIMFLIQMGTVPQDACLETIRLLGEHVLPQLRSTERSGR